MAIHSSNETYILVLIRHGQSLWNLQNRFTGWIDIPLSEEGRREAHQAANLLNQAGFTFDMAFTSVLKRAIHNLWIMLEDMHLEWIPVYRAWQLNERHYGALQGLNKADTAAWLGETLVKSWRRSYEARPPRLEWDDSRHPRFDRRYAALSPEELPGSESLRDTYERLLPYWQATIVPALQSGQRVLICAHGNSLRALMKYIDQISDRDIIDLYIPTGIPLVYELNKGLQPIRKYYLGDPETVQKATQAIIAQAQVRGGR